MKPTSLVSCLLLVKKRALAGPNQRGLRPGQENTLRETVAQMAARRLARELLSCGQPLSDPRGRPTFFELTRREREKRLGLT